jgi:hypothetical protein
MNFTKHISDHSPGDPDTASLVELLRAQEAELTNNGTKAVDVNTAQKLLKSLFRNTFKNSGEDWK